MAIPPCLHDPVKSDTTWEFSVTGRCVQTIDPRTLTAADIARLRPMREANPRRRRSTADPDPGYRGQHHLPRHAWLPGRAAHVGIESELEHQLLRRLARPSVSTVVVPQPCRVQLPQFPGSRTPDFLQVDHAGAVTVWNCRSLEDQDDDFAATAAAMDSACAAAGWTHQVFDGSPLAEHLNLLWLNGFRIERPWHADRRAAVLAAAGPKVALGHLLDVGDAEFVSTVWHLVWTGDLLCDLEHPITEATAVQVAQ